MKTAILLAVVAVTFVACGRGGADAELEGLPRFDEVALEISGGAEEGLEGALQQGLAGQPPEMLVAARASVKALNSKVRETLQGLAAVADAGQGQPVPNLPDVRMYGPQDRGGITYRLFIKKIGQDAFGFRLEAKGVGAADDAYQRAMAGRVLRRQAQGGGRSVKGQLGVSLDVLKAIDPAFKGQGVLLAGFGSTGQTRTLAYRLKDFTPDLAARPPVSAAFVGHKAASGLRRVRLAGLHNLSQSATDAKELVRLRVRHLPGTGGRGDGIATGGDVPAGKVWRAVACWDAQDGETFQRVFECAEGGPASSCTSLPAFEVGAVSACGADFQNDAPPPMDASDATPEEGAPEGDIVPPAELPSGEE